MLAAADSAPRRERDCRGGGRHPLDHHTFGSALSHLPGSPEILLRNVSGRQAPGVHK